MNKAPRANCDECPYKDRKIVKGWGAPPETCKAVLIGEAPGRDESRWGVPFIGKSGVLLRAILAQQGFHIVSCTEHLKAIREGREVDTPDVYLTNAALCLPPPADEDTYKTSQEKKQAALQCRDRLMAELWPYITAKTHIPICTLGGASTMILTGEDAITKMRGHWYIENSVLATWHPAYILRQPSRVGELSRDIHKLTFGRPAYLDHAKPAILFLDTDDKMEMFTEILLGMVARGEVLDNTIAFDIEADNIDYRIHRILSVQISWEVDVGAVIPETLIHSPVVRNCLTKLFDSSSGIKWVGHNAKFDCKFLYYQLGIWNVRIDYDSLLGDYVLDENRMHGLKELIGEYYGLPDYEKEMILPYLKSKNDMYSKVPRPLLYWYGVYDTTYTLRLWRDVRVQLEEQGLFEQPFMFPIMACQPMFLDMELHGMLLDRHQLAHLSQLLQEHLTGMRQELIDLAEAPSDLNLNSPQQVSAIMYDHFDMPKQKVRGLKDVSTAKPVRQIILRTLREEGMVDTEAFQWLDMYGRWKALEKIRSSYVDNTIPLIDKHGRVHPDILAYGTETGRVSVRNPALQTIPRKGTGKAFGREWGKEIKLCYCVPDGYKLAQIDYSQAELRTAAWLSQDPFLMDCYHQDRDIHGEVAEAFFPGYHAMKPEDRMETAIGLKSKSDLRKEVKKCVFGRLYLGTAYTIMDTLNCTMTDAKHYLAILDSKLGGLVKFERAQWKQMRETGYVETLTGRRRRQPLITRQNQEESRKAACNAPVQGMAADLTLIAAYEIWRWLNDPDVNEVIIVDDTPYRITHDDLLNVHVLLTVHDSIILECPEYLVKPVASKVRVIMEMVGNKWMPGIPWKADIEVGTSWGDLEEVSWK